MGFGFCVGYLLAYCCVIFFIGVRDYARSDWIALIACIIAIPVWKLTQSPLIAIFIIVAIDALTY